jgi:tRNA threonylcarbamoyladenosine biosynthesis protein TsaE
MAETFTFDAVDELGTEILGFALAAALPDSAVVALIGPLGAGKTRLVQAVAIAAAVEQGIVASPTFVLVHEYAGRVPIYHFDAYRLRDEDEFLGLGPDEYFNERGWCFIEWADRVAACLPADRLEISIEPTAATARRFTFRAFGPRHASIVAVLQRTLATDEHSREN